MVDDDSALMTAGVEKQKGRRHYAILEKLSSNGTLDFKSGGAEAKDHAADAKR